MDRKITKQNPISLSVKLLFDGKEIVEVPLSKETGVREPLLTGETKFTTRKPLLELTKEKKDGLGRTPKGKSRLSTLLCNNGGDIISNELFIKTGNRMADAFLNVSDWGCFWVNIKQFEGKIYFVNCSYKSHDIPAFEKIKAADRSKPKPTAYFENIDSEENAPKIRNI